MIPVFTRLHESLRFSAMRDGLQDYEYLWVLEQALSRIKQTMSKEAFWLNPRQRPLELCRRVVWSFHEYNSPTIRIEAEYQGKKCTVERTFKLTD